MKSWGNSRDVKNASIKDRARFRPSVLIPLRIIFMTGGNMSSVIESPCISIEPPSYFFGCSFGVFLFPQSKASINNSFASPGSQFGMNDFIFVIFSGSASVGLKFSIWSLSKTIEAKAVFSWREYGARKRWRGDTRTTSTESSVDFIVSSVLNSVILFFLISPPYELVASNFAVLILHAPQNWISLWETRSIFP